MYIPHHHHTYTPPPPHIYPTTTHTLTHTHTASVTETAALLMRCIAEDGAAAAAPMREGALSEGALLHHLLGALSGSVCVVWGLWGWVVLLVWCAACVVGVTGCVHE